MSNSEHFVAHGCLYCSLCGEPFPHDVGDSREGLAARLRAHMAEAHADHVHVWGYLARTGRKYCVECGKFFVEGEDDD